jgi:hypothetical protein
MDTGPWADRATGRATVRCGHVADLTVTSPWSEHTTAASHTPTRKAPNRSDIHMCTCIPMTQMSPAALLYN